MTDNQLRSDIFLAFVNDKETAEVVRSLALSRYGLKIDVHQATIKAAISYLQLHNSPRILLIDITGSDFPVSDMKAIADVCEPGVQVIAIGETNDVGLFRDLVSLGVKDYIAKPLNLRLLVQSIENLIGGASTSKRTDAKFSYAGKLVSFLGARGGVGSSTIAANTAWALAHGHYKRVCLADLDFSSGIMNQIFNLDVSSNLKDLLKMPDRVDEEILMRSVVKASDYLSTLSAPQPIDEDFPFPTEAINACLPMLMHHFHYTVLDFPRYHHRTHYPLLVQSGVIVLTFEFSLICVREVVSLLRLLKSTQDVQLILVGNQTGQYKKGELDRKIFEESIGQAVDLVIPFDTTKALQTLNEGKPAASERGALSDGIYALTSLITGKEAQSSPSSGSFLSGLFGGGKAGG
jgi:pilus assembly protein CpaE